VAEKKANRWDFDAVSVSSPELEALSREKLLRKQFRLARGNAEGTLPAHRRWAPPIINVFVQAYNTQAVKKRDLPERWTDLLEPGGEECWRGKLKPREGIAACSGTWREKGTELFRQIAARNGLSVAQPAIRFWRTWSFGRVPMALAVYSHMIDQPATGRAGRLVRDRAGDRTLERRSVSRRPASSECCLAVL